MKKRRGIIKDDVADYRYAGETAFELFKRFTAQKETENLSSNSIVVYTSHFEIYLRSLVNEKESPAYKTCTLSNYNSFIMYLKSSGIKDVSVASYCRSIRAIFY